MSKPVTTPEASAHCRAYHGFTFGLYRFVGNMYAKSYLGFRTQTVKTEQDGACLILCNSQTLQDELLVRLAFDRPVYCVQTRGQRRGPSGMVTDLLTSPIAQKPGPQTWSQAAVQGIKKVVAEGGSICLFPCGAPTYTHTPAPISKQTVPLIRALGIPVILYTLHGGIGALPRWGDGRRKGPFIGRCERTLLPEEYAAMSDADLHALIARTLQVNDKPLGLTYHSSRRAERLERVLYVCPRCREHSALYTQGNHVSCRACGMTANYTEAGNFVFLNCETPITTLEQWMEYQTSWLQNRLESFQGNIFTEPGVTILSVDREPADEPLFGTLIMTREKLLLRFEDGQAGTRTVGFALDSVAMLTPCAKTKLTLTTAQGTWEITGPSGFCAHKYAQLFKALRGQLKK